MGEIGKAVARIAAALGMKVIAYTPHPMPMDYVTYVPLKELWRRADVISLHCPLFETTRRIVDNAAIETMKNGVILINTARGPLIDEEALYSGLEDGKIAWAALDVMEKEPPETGNRLLRHPRVIATPHIGWAPFEARKRLMNIAIENLKAFQRGEPIHVVNR